MQAGVVVVVVVVGENTQLVTSVILTSTTNNLRVLRCDTCSSDGLSRTVSPNFAWVASTVKAPDVWGRAKMQVVVFLSKHAEEHVTANYGRD